MQIQVIEKKTGLDRATIRYYEQEGLIKTDRLANGYRDYSDNNLQDLLKIKLLRELGLSVDTILQLIEGNSNLNTVLESQIVVLKDHKSNVDNAEILCNMILQDNVTYETIDPGKYRLSSVASKYIDVKSEHESPQIHPFRHFFSRFFDYLLIYGIIIFVCIVILQIRPYGKLQRFCFAAGATLLCLPVSAMFLRICGTTPGKFVCGIFLKSPEGENMSFLFALRREWAVLRYGIGFNIPVLNLFHLYKSYKIHKNGMEPEWNYALKATTNYKDYDGTRQVFTVVFSIICIFFVMFSAKVGKYPKYRNENLTLSQFAENFNDYAKQTLMDSYFFSIRSSQSRLSKLSPEGEWNVPTSSTSDNAESWEFITDENQSLREIKIKVDTEYQTYTANETVIAIYTAIMSTPNGTKAQAKEATRQLSDMVYVELIRDEYYEYNDITISLTVQRPELRSDTQATILIDILFL